MREYLRFTSKTIPVALNGKAKDLALRAAQNTPKTKLTLSQFKKQQTDQEFITFVAKRIFDRRGGGRVFSEIRRATAETMAKKRLQKGYMRSGYVKAANAFKAVKDASKAPRITLEGRFENTKAETKQATERNLAALFDIEWSAKGSADSSQKQAIVTPAIAKAVAFVTADMRAYILRKMEQQAKKNSASTVRAIAGVFR